MMRNTLPPLASNDLFGFALRETELCLLPQPFYSIVNSSLINEDIMVLCVIPFNQLWRACGLTVLQCR